MKMKILLFISMLMVCNFAYGEEVSRENYDKAVDYLNCSTVLMSLKDDNNKDNYNHYLLEVPCDENVSFSKINDYLKRINIERTTKLSDEIETLKNTTYNDGLKPDGAATFLSNDVFKEKNYPNLIAFANKREGKSDFIDFKKRIKDEIIKKLTGESSVVLKTAVDNSSNLASGANKSINSNSNKNPSAGSNTDSSEGGGMFDNLLSWIPIVGAGLFVIAMIVLCFIWLRSLQNKIFDLQGSIESLKRVKINNSPTAKPLASQTSAPQTDEMDAIKKELYDLKKVFEELKKQIENGKSTPEKFNPKGQESLKLQPQESFHKEPSNEQLDRQERQYNREVAREVFYLASPNEDGSFNKSSASSLYKDSASIYKFTRISHNKAEFQIDERDSSIKNALEYPDKSIDPVCEAQNAFDPKATRILTVQVGFGIAELEGDKWKVTRKAKIRYER